MQCDKHLDRSFCNDRFKLKYKIESNSKVKGIDRSSCQSKSLVIDL